MKSRFPIRVDFSDCPEAIRFRDETARRRSEDWRKVDPDRKFRRAGTPERDFWGAVSETACRLEEGLWLTDETGGAYYWSHKEERDRGHDGGGWETRGHTLNGRRKQLRVKYPDDRGRAVPFLHAVPESDTVVVLTGWIPGADYGFRHGDPYGPDNDRVYWVDRAFEFTGCIDRKGVICLNCRGADGRHQYPAQPWCEEVERLISDDAWWPASGAGACAEGCGWPLDPKLMAVGVTTHPSCGQDEAVMV